MTIASMTGFARMEGVATACSWTWEAKSVNARGLDVRCRLPNGFEALEPAARQRVAAAMKRGNVSLNLQLTWSAAQQAIRINTDVLEQVLALVTQIEGRLRKAGPPSADGLLSLRGVIEAVDPMPTGEARIALEAALLAGVDAVLAALVQMRLAEGSQLAIVLRDNLARLSDSCDRARDLAAMQPDAILARLSQQIISLLGEIPALPPERLAQEAALLAAKADPREELDRLRAHHQAACALLAGGGAVGRQLDFLCQELNREANTLCAKSAGIELTRIGLELKQTVEQIREQVQNIE